VVNVALTPDPETVNEVRTLLQQADAVLVGAGAGMSIPAGIDLNDRAAFANAYPAMLQYGFEYGYQLLGYPYPDERLRWGFLSASLMNSARLGIDPSYQYLKRLLSEKEHFVVTTNVDRLFHKNGFDTERLYTPQGDSFLLQCKQPCSDAVWDALPLLADMEQQIDPATQYLRSEDAVPTCPRCGGPVYMNVRSGPFYIDKHYEAQRTAMNKWLQHHANHRLVLLEIGVGFNTPGVIRKPFEQLALSVPHITLIRINPLEALGPPGTVSVSAGVKETLHALIQTH